MPTFQAWRRIELFGAGDVDVLVVRQQLKTAVMTEIDEIDKKRGL
jgi:hypothetical protein